MVSQNSVAKGVVLGSKTPVKTRADAAKIGDEISDDGDVKVASTEDPQLVFENGIKLQKASALVEIGAIQKEDDGRAKEEV